VAKKLSDIESIVTSQNELFWDFLEKTLANDVFDFLNSLRQQTEVYLFSGVIRNYFLKNYSIRDLDLVIKSESNLQELFSKYEHRRNSFGGYKFSIGDLEIDLWSIDKTWAFKNHQMILGFELDKYMPLTAFFNFSSIIYSTNEKKFIYSKYFLTFLRDREIDVVYEPNANYQLCVVNSFYYADRYKLKISDNLKKLIIRLYHREPKDYQEIQKKHFGQIL
jgi:hypothetical protein